MSPSHMPEEVELSTVAGFLDPNGWRHLWLETSLVGDISGWRHLWLERASVLGADDASDVSLLSALYTGL